MQFRIGNETVNSYKRLSYTAWHAIAEFIDNSTQAYFDNRPLLDASYASSGTRLTVNVVYDHSQNRLTIIDNSIGMNQSEMEAALEVAGHPPKTTGRSKYGMGLKTAACWFGNRWQIKTKKLGETQEITVTVDVDRIASGDIDISPRVIDTGEPNNHYTELTIYDLHKKLSGRTIGKIKRFLASMYRCDLRDGVMNLFCQNAPVEWEGIEHRILRATDGSLYRKELDFNVPGHNVRGWIAVLGAGGREYAGFTILQNNRVVRGYPDAWRPTTLFGQEQGSNNLINQRLLGELHLDSYAVSHTKDNIIWQGEEEDQLEDELLSQARDYKTVASTPYKNRDGAPPNQEIVDTAVDQLIKDLKSDELVDRIELAETPPEEVIDDAFHAVIVQEEHNVPRIDIRVGSRRVKLHVSYTASINDPYVAIDIDPDETIIIVINMNHPYVQFLDDSSSMTNYLRHCMFDALAMDKARIQRGHVHYNTVQMHKDGLLRVPYEIHSVDPEFDKQDEE